MLEKVSDVTERETAGVGVLPLVPVPDKGSTSGLEGALETAVRVPVRATATVGANSTVTVTLLPAGMVKGGVRTVPATQVMISPLQLLEDE